MKTISSMKLIALIALLTFNISADQIMGRGLREVQNDLDYESETESLNQDISQSEDVSQQSEGESQNEEEFKGEQEMVSHPFSQDVKDHVYNEPKYPNSWFTFNPSTIYSSDNVNFYKGIKNVWSTLRMTYPIERNKITEVTFFLVKGNKFQFGIGPKNDAAFYDNHIGESKYTVTYDPWRGTKDIMHAPLPYGNKSYAGDQIVMRINNYDKKSTLSFYRNGHNMGTAFSGFDSLGIDLYVLLSMEKRGDHFRVTDYKVYEEKQ